MDLFWSQWFYLPKIDTNNNCCLKYTHSKNVG